MSLNVYKKSNNTIERIAGNISSDILDKLTTEIGDVTQLTTTNKSSLVGAVNEVNSKINDSQYKKIGTIYGANVLNFDVNSYDEILVEFMPNSNDEFEGSSLSFIPSSYNFTSKGYVKLRNGYYADSSEYASYSISIEQNKATVGAYSHYKNGSNITQKIRCDIYGKKYT